jgi:hypothetical protein
LPFEVRGGTPAGRIHVLFEPPQTTMTTSHPSRIFNSGDATTLYVTIPAQVVSDSQFPFEIDDAVTVTINDDELVISPNTEEPDE